MVSVVAPASAVSPVCGSPSTPAARPTIPSSPSTPSPSASSTARPAATTPRTGAGVPPAKENKSAPPYLRLRNSKRTSKCQSILFYSTRKNPSVGPNWRARGGGFEIFHLFCRKSSKKIERGSLVKKNRESHSGEKTKGGPFTLIRFCRLRLKGKKPKGDLKVFKY